MPHIFQEYKELIDSYLRKFLTDKKQTLGEINPLGPDLVDRVMDIITRGKTIRGSLVLVSYCFTNNTPSDDAIKLAAAMEFMQTALIIHDDIMDHDEMRRGIKTLYSQYGSEALAICAGDVLFFMAFELIGAIKTDATKMGRIVRLFGREYQSVAVAQMGDVAGSATTKLDIFNLYMYKTARYTFAMPLMLGSILAGPPAQAGTNKEILRYLESYGVAAGILFQIQDDRLDDQKNPFTSADIRAYKQAAMESIDRLALTKKNKNILSSLLTFVLRRNT